MAATGQMVSQERMSMKVAVTGASGQLGSAVVAALKQTPVDQFMALQTPQRVVQWLSLYGKVGSGRTRSVKLRPQLFQEEANSIHVLGRFVEQEQLIEPYEQLIADWLA